MRKTLVKTYNDGVAHFYKRISEKNPRTLDDLEWKRKMAFELKEIRQQDEEFALQQEKKIDLKIATQDFGIMDTTECVLIDQELYAITKVDRNRKRRELYFYLQEIRKIKNA